MPQEALLSEHEARPKDASNASGPGDGGYSPSDAERKLVAKVERLFQKNKKYRSKVDSVWADYCKMYRGRQWNEFRPSYRSSEVINLVWQAIQAQVPFLTDAKPKFEYLPQDPSDREFADLMNDISAADWERQNWLFTMTEVILDSHRIGTGVSKLLYNPEKEQIEYDSCDPFYFYPDVSAESMTKNCFSVVYAEPMDVAMAKRLYPDKAKYIKADITDSASTQRLDLADMRLSSIISDQLDLAPDFQNQADMAQVLVKTAYFTDDEMSDSEEKDPETGEQMKQLKYPHGRKIVTSNNMILRDGPLEYDDHQIPYCRLINYVDSRSFWGVSEVEPIASPQRTFNKLVCLVLDTLYLAGNPVWIVDTGSEVDTDNLTNQPGLVVEKAPGSEVRREMGVALAPGAMAIIDRLKQWFDQLTGTQDITRGVPAGGVTAAAAIEDLQQAAETRIRQKLRNLDAYLQDFGQQYASRVMQFYTAPRVFRLTQKDGTERYFKAYIEKAESGKPRAVVQHYTESGMLDIAVNKYELQSHLDVRVSTGSSLAFDKAKNETRQMNLFDRGIIDAEEVLKNLNYPHWESVLQRVQERQAQVQAQQQQQAQQQAQMKAQAKAS